MSPTRTVLLVSGLCVSTLTACLGGQVKDASTNASLSGVTVTAQNCDGCAVYTATTSSDGTYEFDAYAGNPVIFQDASVDAVKLVFSKAGYHDMTIFHHVVWHDPIAPSTKLWDFAGTSLFASNIGDGDHDGVYDPIDTSMGPFTFDEDGMDDSWELYGNDWVDYAGYGANINKLDLFLEVDYEAYWDNATGAHSARLSDAVVAKLVDFFAHLPTTQGQGGPGISLHVVQDQALPQGFDCAGQYATTSNFHPKRHNAFRYLALCLGSPEAGAESIGGQRMYVRENEVNTDTTDDQTEPAQFFWYASILHAIGHTLGIRHGGGDDVNCKPNYVSLMNNAYDLSVAGSPTTLQGTKIQFATFNSTTVLPSALNESALAEQQPFSIDLTPALVDVLANYGDPGLGKGFTALSGTGLNSKVDWNRNGSFQTGTVSAVITDGSAAGGCPTTIQTLSSYNDTYDLTFGVRRFLPMYKSYVAPVPSTAQVCHLR